MLYRPKVYLVSCCSLVGTAASLTQKPHELGIRTSSCPYGRLAPTDGTILVLPTKYVYRDKLCIPRRNHIHVACNSRRPETRTQQHFHIGVDFSPIRHLLPFSWVKLKSLHDVMPLRAAAMSHYRGYSRTCEDASRVVSPSSVYLDNPPEMHQNVP